MSQAQGSSVSFRMGLETSFGVTGATSYEVPFAPTLDIKETQALNDSSIIRGTRNMDRSFLGFKAVDGSFSVPLDTKSTPKWLEGFFGAPTTAGAGPYIHTFKVNDTSIPSIFTEIAHKDLGEFHLANGIKMNSFDISFGGDGELLLNINAMGQKVTRSATEILSPTDLTNNFNFEQFQAVVTGAVNVKDMSLSYTNNLDGGQYVIGDGGIRGEIPLGMVGVSGSFTALYENDTLLAAARDNVDQTLNITLTNGSGGIAFDMEEVVLEPTGVTVDSPQGLTQTFNYTAFWRAGASSSALVITLTNDAATV
jgi:hypothetical protein